MNPNRVQFKGVSNDPTTSYSFSPWNDQLAVTTPGPSMTRSRFPGVDDSVKGNAWNNVQFPEDDNKNLPTQKMIDLVDNPCCRETMCNVNCLVDQIAKNVGESD